jgi:type II secretory pathway component PulK
MAADHRPARTMKRYPPSPKQHGLAMIAVLWILVALMLMVSSYSLFARVETHMAGAQVNQAKANALALGGAEYIQAYLKQPPQFRNKPHQQQFQLSLSEGRLDMTLTSTAGLIDLNKAPPALLKDLFQIAAGMDEDSIAVLINTLRPDPNQTNGAPPPVLHDIRDLRGMPGITESIYNAVQNLITVDADNGTINAHQAPLGVLTVLAHGNTELAQTFAESRITQGSLADTSMLQTSFHGETQSNRYRLDVDVTISNGQRYSRRLWLSSAIDMRLGWRAHALEPLQALPGGTTP